MTLGRAFDLAGSPIERIFIDEVVMSRGGLFRLVDAASIDRFYDWLRHMAGPFVLIAPQVQVGPFVCDFLVGTFDGTFVTIFAVECDGAEFHGASHQRDRDARRDAILRSAHGIKGVLRFSGVDIHADAEACVEAVARAMGRASACDCADDDNSPSASDDDPDTYDPDGNAYACWKLAIRGQRLQGIRDGRFAPRPDDPEEVEAAKSNINGTWPWWMLGAPPGHPECVVPEQIVTDRKWSEKYGGKITNV